MGKTMLRVALAATALTAGIAVGLPATAHAAAPATRTSVTASATTEGDWGWRRHHRFPFFGRFGFPIATPFVSPFGFGGFPCFDGFGGFSSSFGVSPFGFGGDCCDF